MFDRQSRILFQKLNIVIEGLFCVLEYDFSTYFLSKFAEKIIFDTHKRLPEEYNFFVADLRYIIIYKTVFSLLIRLRRSCPFFAGLSSPRFFC